MWIIGEDNCYTIPYDPQGCECAYPDEICGPDNCGPVDVDCYVPVQTTTQTPTTQPPYCSGSCFNVWSAAQLKWIEVGTTCVSHQMDCRCTPVTITGTSDCDVIEQPCVSAPTSTSICPGCTSTSSSSTIYPTTTSTTPTPCGQCSWKFDSVAGWQSAGWVCQPNCDCDPPTSDISIGGVAMTSCFPVVTTTTTAQPCANDCIWQFVGSDVSTASWVQTENNCIDPCGCPEPAGPATQLNTSLPMACSSRTTTIEPTTTTINPCSGTCRWKGVGTSGSPEWLQIANNCKSCDCSKPALAPQLSLVLETPCAGATTTTEPPAPCSGCIWVWDYDATGTLTWLIVVDGCDFENDFCGCDVPGSGFDEGVQVGDTVQTECWMPGPTGASTTTVGPCSYCQYHWNPHTAAWVLLRDYCGSCSCRPPSVAGREPWEERKTVCLSTTTPAPTTTTTITSTTTTTANPCGGNCFWSSTDGTTWTLQSSNCSGAGCGCVGAEPPSSPGYVGDSGTTDCKT